MAGSSSPTRATAVLVLSARGDLIRSLGRSGAGPGDIQTVWELAVIADTILTYDTGLQRVSLWTPADGFIRSASLAFAQEPLHELLAFVSPNRFILTSLLAQSRTNMGLATNTVAIVSYDAPASRRDTLVHREWDQTYAYVQTNGITRFATPFLGSAHLAVSVGRFVTVPLAGAEVQVASLDGAAFGTIPLPVTRRAFDRALVDAYRDSLLRSAQRSTAVFPGALERIRAVLGSEFLLPILRPVVESVRTVGAEVWLRLFPESADSTTWYVVDAQRAVLAGRGSIFPWAGGCLVGTLGAC